MNIDIIVIASKITDGFVVIDTVIGQEAADAKFKERQAEVEHQETLLGNDLDAIHHHAPRSSNHHLYTESGSFVAMKRA